MGFETILTEVLAERTGLSQADVKALIRGAFAESSRRRWAALSPEDKQRMEEEIEKSRRGDETPFPPEMVSHIPLSLLPFFTRRTREDLATARAVWWESYVRYQELLKRLTLWYHEEQRLQITAAEKKAAVDERVQAAADESRRFKDTVEGLERAESNLVQELEVRLTLVKAGVLQDPEAVPTNMGFPRSNAV